MRGWKGEDKCSLCEVSEDTNHVIFRCVVAKFAWCCMREMLHWDRCLDSLDDMHIGWLDSWGANGYNIGLFSFAAMA